MQATSGDLAKTVLLGALCVLGVFFIVSFVRTVAARKRDGEVVTPTPVGLGIGFVTNFFDTLGIGSFAPTTAIFRGLKIVPDERIPGTLNVGHTLPTIVQTLIFTTIVPVESTTLIAMIAAAVLGAWLGAGIVSKMPKNRIQWGMGLCLLGAATLMVLSLMKIAPASGDALGVTGMKMGIAIGGNFILGALMTLGIGLYAPCLILVSFLGMNVTAAFPIMMGSCAFLMPFASMRFAKEGKFDARAAIGLSLAGVPAVLLAAFVVKSLPLDVLRWVVVVVILYTALTLLRSAAAQKATA